MEQDLLLRHYTAEQQHDVLDAQLLKQKVHTGARDRDGRRLWRLQCLLVTRSNGEPHLGTTRRWHLNASQDVANQCLQWVTQALTVHRVDRAQTVPEHLRVVQARDQDQALGCIHDAVVRDGGHIRGQGIASGRGQGFRLLLLVNGFVGGDGHGLIKAEACTVVAIRIDVGEDGHEELGLVALRAQ